MATLALIVVVAEKAGCQSIVGIFPQKLDTNE